MLVVAANYSYLMRLRHGFGGVSAYTKEAFGDDHAFLCAWFLCLSYISILFLNATALYVVARLLMGGALLSTPSYVLAGRTVYLGEVALSVGALIVSGVAFIVHKPALQRVHTVLAVCLLAGVAALALGKGVRAIHQSGKWFTDDNIDGLLMDRHLAKKARHSGKHHLKGPAKRTVEDDRRFAESFEQLICEEMPDGRIIEETLLGD